MGRRSYSYSYSPSSPPRSYRRRGRSPSPRDRYGGDGHRDLPTSLLVRNLRQDCRPEDLRMPFGQFGSIKDIYLPRDYYSGEQRGFGFVQFLNPADAADAKYEMDGQILLGRKLTVVFAAENRKRPADMRARERIIRPRSKENQRSSYYSRHSRSHSLSPSPRYAKARSRSRSYHSPPRRHHSRSFSPEERRRRRRHHRERSYTRSVSVSPCRRETYYSRSPIWKRRSYSPSPGGGGASRSRSR